jgi:hypothetical protein
MNTSLGTKIDLPSTTIPPNDAPIEIHRTTHKLTPEALERKRLALELDLRRKRALQDLQIQEFLVYFPCLTLGASCLTTLVMFVLQGFHTAGFDLDKSLMHWMGGATIGSIGGRAMIVYKRLIRPTHREPDEKGT